MNYSLSKFVRTAFVAMATAYLAEGLAINPAQAQAGIFEVIHPDVEEGQVEIEILSGVGLGSVEDGEERSVHEFAIGYSVRDYWKITAAVEVANPQGDNPEVEAFEFSNLLILSGHGHHDDGDDKDEDHHGFVLGFHTGLEIPVEGGIGQGGIEFGPVIEAELGELEFVGNLFVEVPFADGEDAGLAYATQLFLPVSEGFGVGIENYGEFEGLFGERGDDIHFAGPALYWETELANGTIIEPRVAVLFGLNDETPDAVLSFNLELKL